MTDPNETDGLLREIRDLLAQREQQYQEHLTNTEAAYAKHRTLHDEALKEHYAAHSRRDWRIAVTLLTGQFVLTCLLIVYLAITL